MPSLLKRLIRKADAGESWETLSRVAVTLSLLGSPVLVLSWTNDFWELPKALLLLVTVGLGWVFYFIAALRRREHRWQMSKFDWLVVGLWLSVTVSMLTSVQRWQSLTGISGSLTEAWPVVTAFVGLYFLTGQVFRTEAERRIGWGGLLAGLGLSLVFQMFQFSDFSLLTPSLPRANTVFSVVSNSLTDVSVLAALFGSMVLLFWGQPMEQWQRWSVFAGVTLSWLVVLLSGRPVAWAVWAIGMIAVVLHQAARGKKADTRMIAAAVILAALGMSAQLFGLHRQAGLANGPDVTLDQSTTRSIVAKVLPSRPLFGTGGTTWYQNFVSERPTTFNESTYWSTRFIKATTAWWQALATTGFFGALAWATILAWAGWRYWKDWAQSPNWMTLGGLFVVVATIVTGFFTGWSLPLLVLTWFVLGLQRSLVVHAKNVKARPLGLGLPFAMILSMLLIVSTWFFAGRVMMSDVIVRQAQAAISQQDDLSRIIQKLEAAQRLNSHQADAAVLLAGAYVTQAELALQSTESSAATTLVQKAVTTMRAAIARDPKNPALYEASNNLLNRLNAYVADAVEEASSNFSNLRKLEPVNPIHDVGYGQTLMIQRARLLAASPTDEQKTQAGSMLELALKAYDEALRKKADYPQAVYAKAQALTANGQPTVAISLLEPLVASYASVPAFWAELATAQSAAKLNEAAVTSFTRAIDLTPTDAGLYLALAEHYIQATQTDEAKKTLERGLQQVPNDESLKTRLEKLTTPPVTS